MYQESRIDCALRSRTDNFCILFDVSARQKKRKKEESCQRSKTAEAEGQRAGRRAVAVDTQFRTGATRWGVQRTRVNGISPVSQSFCTASRCDNRRIKSAHYCVIGIRGVSARYYGCSTGPRNGGPTRRSRSLVSKEFLPSIPSSVLRLLQIGRNKRKTRRCRTRAGDAVENLVLLLNLSFLGDLVDDPPSRSPRDNLRFIIARNYLRHP